MLEKEIFTLRAYVAQRKWAVVLDEVSSASPKPLQAVRMLAEYLAKPAKRCVVGIFCLRSS